MDLKDVIAGTTRPPVPLPSQNLINPTRTASFGRPAGYWKSIALDFLSVIAAFLFGYAYSRYLAGSASPWYVLGTFFFFSTCSALQVFLAKGIGRRTAVILGEAVVMIAPFAIYDNWEIIGLTGTIVFIVLLWGYFMSWSASKNDLELQFFRITRNALGKVVTATLALMILVYAPQVDGKGVFLPQQSFKTFFDWAAQPLNGFYPALSFTGSFGDFSQGLAKMELRNNPSFASLGSAAQNTAITQSSEQLAQSIASVTGVVPMPSDTMSSVAYNYIVAMLSGLRNRFPNQFLTIWVVLLFLILRTVGVVVVWIAQLVALVVYEILLASGFMHIEDVTRTKETVAY